jgi:hypothetical protein
MRNCSYVDCSAKASASDGLFWSSSVTARKNAGALLGEDAQRSLERGLRRAQLAVHPVERSQFRPGVGREGIEIGSLLLFADGLGEPAERRQHGARVEVVVRGVAGIEREGPLGVGARALPVPLD